MGSRALGRPTGGSWCIPYPNFRAETLSYRTSVGRHRTPGQVQLADQFLGFPPVPHCHYTTEAREMLGPRCVLGVVDRSTRPGQGSPPTASAYNSNSTSTSWGRSGESPDLGHDLALESGASSPAEAGQVDISRAWSIRPKHQSRKPRAPRDHWASGAMKRINFPILL